MGAHVVGPSGMMDWPGSRDQDGFGRRRLHDVLILAYAAKFGVLTVPAGGEL